MKAQDAATIVVTKATDSKKKSEQSLKSAQNDANKAAKNASTSQDKFNDEAAKQAAADKRHAKASEKLTAAKTQEENLMVTMKKSEGAYEIKPEGSVAHSDEMLTYYKASVWPRSKANDYWTDLVVADIKANWNQLNEAQDVNTFCPGYNKAPRRQQVICWLRLVGAVVQLESNFKVDDSMHEADLGYASVGLFSLSRRECPLAMTEQLLHNPVLNLSCGIGKMAGLISRHGYIAGKDGRRGASGYWSTLRTPYESNDMKLGKQAKVLAITQKYTDFR